MLLLGVICPVMASAAELYRYVDERGVVVLDRHGVPPQHISRGYQVLNEQGRIDPLKLDLVGRLGGSAYCRTRDLFQMQRP